MPDELLLKILSHIDDIDPTMLAFSETCTRLETFAINMIRQRYAHESFKIHVHYMNLIEEKNQKESFLIKFGRFFTDLEIQFIGNGVIDEDHWIYQMLQHCAAHQISITYGEGLDLRKLLNPVATTIGKLSLIDLTTENHDWAHIMFQNLLEFKMSRVHCGCTENCNLNMHVVEHFISNHAAQIEKIDIDSDTLDINALRTIGPLPELRTLSLNIMENPDQDVSLPGGGRWSMDNLEILNLIGFDGDVAQTLKYFADCTNLEELTIDPQQQLTWDDQTVQSIHQFENLRSLSVCAFNMAIHTLSTIVQLPRLTSLTLLWVHDQSFVFENINEVVEICCSRLDNLNLNFPFSTRFSHGTISSYIRQLTEVHDCQVQLTFRDMEVVFSNGVVNILRT